MVRVGTYNTKHSAKAVRYRGNPKLFEEACEQFSPENLNLDILALQEVDNGVLRSGHKDLAGIAAKASGMVPIFAHTMHFNIGSYGNGLLVRGEVLEYSVLPLGEEQRFRKGIAHYLLRYSKEPRNAIMARVRTGGQEFSVAATHLSTTPDMRKRQLGMVVSALADMPGPRILLGDLNQSDKSLRKSGILGEMQLVEHDPTFPAPMPRRAIDHIALDGLSYEAVRTVRLPVSDHLALIADVR